MRKLLACSMTALSLLACAGIASAQVPETPKSAAPDLAAWVIGSDDVLDIVFWNEKDLSGEVVVRPDGQVTVPILGDVAAAGLTPAALAERLRERASEILEFPRPTVTVRQINSRKVFITGEVAKPGRYPLVGPITVLELIAMAGGLSEYADRKNIGIVRTAGDSSVTFKFNYAKASKLQELDRNIRLLPGDIVIVP